MVRTFVIVTGQLTGGNELPTLSRAYANVIYDCRRGTLAASALSVTTTPCTAPSCSTANFAAGSFDATWPVAGP